MLAFSVERIDTERNEKLIIKLIKKRNMSKKIFAILIVAVVAVFAGYNVYQSQKGEMMSDLMLANVEALARYEINPDCPNGCTSASSYCYCFKKLLFTE
ncbi:MAG: NVEALA domain-containing protein [Capnocytophaga ochracea]